MHNAALRAMGLDIVYLAYEVSAGELPHVLRSMQAMGFLGCNLTIPLKEVAFSWIADLSDAARLSGSVNTVIFKDDGSMRGDSTDGVGLTMSLQESFDRTLGGCRVLLLGCGGAGRAAALQAAQEGASCLLLSNRTQRKAETLQAELAERFPSLQTVVTSWPPGKEEVQSADLVLQSTSMGMNPSEPALLSREMFTPTTRLLDMVYTQSCTPIMQEVLAAGGEAVNGLGMLCHQGAKSLELWTGRVPPVTVMQRALAGQVNGADA
jgi:shikimate dehydrogenase